MKNFLYFIIAVTTLSSCMKKVTLEEQSVSLWQLVEAIDHKELKGAYLNNEMPITATVTGYCDRGLDESQITLSDLYGKIEMWQDDKLILTCTRKKTDGFSSFWGNCNPIKLYLSYYGGSYGDNVYCACEINGKFYEIEGGYYSLGLGSIKTYSLPESEIPDDLYVSWQKNCTENSYEITAWYPNGQIKYRFAGNEGYWHTNELSSEGGMIYKNESEEYYLRDGKPSNQFEVLFSEQQRSKGFKYLQFTDGNKYFVMYPSDDDPNTGRAAIIMIYRDKSDPYIRKYKLIGNWEYQVLNSHKLYLYNGVDGLYNRNNFSVSVYNLEDNTMCMTTPTGRHYFFKYAQYNSIHNDILQQYRRQRIL